MNLQELPFNYHFESPKKINRFLLLGLLFIIYGSSNAQTNINGSFSVIGEMGVFGNLQLSADAQVYFQNGSTLHMLGSTTTISPDAEIFANTASTQAGTGRILFVGSAAQTLDGGNSSTIGGAQPSLINIAINNPDNLTLTNNNTRITSGLDFIDGHVILGSNNLELSSSATATNANGTRHVVTNGTGFMAKEDFSTSFNFPVGRATSDYTPATITPSASDNFFVQVKNYSESASDEVTTADGIDRTWNIFSTIGSGASLALQHNTATNGADYTANGGDALAFVTQYEGIQWVTSTQQNQGVWQIGTGAIGTNTAGSVASSVIHTRTYSNTATSGTADAAFFSKSTLELTPLPISLLYFKASKFEDTKSLLSWATTSEINSSHFEVETSTNGESWTKIGEVKAKGNSYQLTNYQLVHPNPTLGVNYYRLNLVDLDGSAEYSPVKTLKFESFNSSLSNVEIFPNPSLGLINIRTENSYFSFVLVNIDGKVLNEFNNQTDYNELSVDLSQYANGVYYIKANSQNGDIKVFKIVLNK